MMTSLVAWESTLYMQVEVSSPPTQRIYGGPLLVEQSIIHILTFLRYWSKPSVNFVQPRAKIYHRCRTRAAAVVDHLRRCLLRSVPAQDRLGRRLAAARRGRVCGRHAVLPRPDWFTTLPRWRPAARACRWGWTASPLACASIRRGGALVLQAPPACARFWPSGFGSTGSSAATWRGFEVCFWACSIN